MISRIRYSRFVYWLKGDLTIRGALAHWLMRRAAKHYYEGWIPTDVPLEYVTTSTPDGRYTVRITPRGPSA